MPDYLDQVFTDEVIATLRSARNPSESLQWRLKVLNASGPLPLDEIQALDVMQPRAQKAAWEVYLQAAFACGMFEGKRGVELTSRLVGTDDDGFRSAMSECMTCWYLAAFLKFPTVGETAGRDRKNLDLQINLPSGPIGVEVKAPFRERPVGAQFWYGHDSDKIAACFDQANKQFDKESANLLVVAPSLRTPMFGDRRTLVRAAFGESVITFDLNPKAGRLENHRLEFSPKGKFLNAKLPSGKLIKPNGLPGFQRIGAVMCIEEVYRSKYPCHADAFMLAALIDHDRSELIDLAVRQRDRYHSRENEMWVRHNVLILHNPLALRPLPEDIWGDSPQLVPRGDQMAWTDGYNGFV